MKKQRKRRAQYCSIVAVFFLFVVAGGSSLSQPQSVDIPPRPSDVTVGWKNLIGEYADKYDTLYVAEYGGHLRLMTKADRSYELTQSGGGRFGFSGQAPFDDPALVFHWNGNTRPFDFTSGGKTFKRLILGNENGMSFHITPLKPVADLRTIALAATPPNESGDFYPSDLVDVSTLDPTIKFDIRYATTNNFAGAQFYSEAKAFLQRPAAEALLRAHHWLKKYGFGVLIHDAYRPWYVTKMFWDATPDDKKIFVANPASGSRHNRGCAVDLTLYDLKTGKQVEMTGGYDEMSERSYPSYVGGTSLERWHRQILQIAMEMQGFRVYPWEWWHFDYKDWKHYAIGTKTFEELAR